MEILGKGICILLSKIQVVAKLKKRASWQQHAAERPSAIQTRLIEKMIIAKGIYIVNKPKPMALTVRLEKCKQEMIS